MIYSYLIPLMKHGNLSNLLFIRARNTVLMILKIMGMLFPMNTGKFFGQFDFVNGYRFSEFLKVGVGISPRVGLSTIPIYVQARGNLISQEDTMFAFFWNADLGYTINSGIYASPSVGMKFGGIRHNFLIGIQYSFEGQKPKLLDQPMHLVGLRIGYEF